MNAYIKRTLVVISAAGNVLFVLFLVFAFSQESKFISYLDMDTGETVYTTGVCIVSLPKEGANLVFAPVEFSLKPGGTAALQFSALLQGSQMNIAMEPLYDRNVVSVEQSGYGFIIRALSPGEAILQTITSEGIRDIARVTVTETF